MLIPSTPVAAFQARRAALIAAFNSPALIAAGQPRARNYCANQYPFRAKSHFLYFVREPIPGASLLFAHGTTTLFVEPEQPGDALWTGPHSAQEELRERYGLDAVRPTTELEEALATAGGPVATLPTEDAASARWLSEHLGRTVIESTGAKLEDGSTDAALADVMISLRLRHDEAALAQLRAAASVTAAGHVAGMLATREATTEAGVFGAVVGRFRSSGCEDSFAPIVSTRGEVLHNESHGGEVRAGHLLLVDAGAETPEGWAGDVTRVWPVSGRFSGTQRAVYEAVLDVQVTAIAACKAGVRYRQVHEVAKRRMVERLVDLGIFTGDVDGLLERGAAAIFFPHGVGHLLGLDVHDLEDLGDRAGYAPGRTRSAAFGDCYLRLDRDLVAGMAVTIEPGFYQVPGILADAAYTGAVGSDLHRDVLAKFADVRGIRIEDDVLITDGAPEVMTSEAPKSVEAVEALVRG